ncbi:DUF4178 domain-containing protein [Comamonas fluminis]|uniref:DUF4178 domain-containing protein n=1 Tax=Comamonas fluminis TaxID=2796366 RepID=UPI001C474DD6|nr:DUF4178 domain-containing protein [Comamonas fluminis]
MASSPSQRDYSAPCPGCGAPVHFSSAQASFAVCEFCRSTVVRDGEVLRRIGSMAEVFEDYSPLRIGASGMFKRDGKPEPFTLVGRAQYKSGAGNWSEWIATLSNGELAYLSEDNGSFIFALPWTPPGWDVKAFSPQQWRMGREVAAGADSFTVTSIQDAQLMAAQGELSQLPELGKSFKLVELRNDKNQILSLDFSGKQPSFTLGVPVQLEGLQMQGLRDAATKKEEGRHFNCPKCGAVVPVRFDSTKALSCPSCGSLIDMSKGMGSELSFAEQRRKVRPLIPMGTEGTLDGLKWQVVGFQRREGRGLGEDEDDSFVWDEYLLYNKKAGFSFIVDSEDGWSTARVVSGAPKLSKNGGTATYLQRKYQRDYAYLAETQYAEGEFYWPVFKGQKSSNVDYADSGKQSTLAMETASNETTWTHGRRVSADSISLAFGVGKLKDRSQVGPVSGSGFSWGTIVFWLCVLLFLSPLLRACISSSNCDPRTDPDCSYSRSSSGSYGGYTSGGSHK